MKSSFLYLLLVCVLLDSISTGFSAAFQDLNFEAATIAVAPANATSSGPENPISAAAALPGWTVKLDTTVCNAVGGGNGALDETQLILNYTGNPMYSSTPVDGTYSVELDSALYAGATGSQGYYATSSLSQTGLVPAGTHSIRFAVENSGNCNYGTGPMVTLGGTQIVLRALSTTNGITTMAGDVSAFAGTTATLTFAAQGASTNYPTNESGYLLDDIQFSTLGVPEPSTYFFGFGLVGLLVWKSKELRERRTTDIL